MKLLPATARLACVVALLFATMPVQAAAPDEPNIRRATEAVRRGHRAMADGDASTALDEYRRAQREVPEANLPHKFEAEALSALERWQEATAAYELYLRLKPDVHDAPQVRAQIEQIRRTHLEGLVDIPCTPAGGDVYLDDASTALGRAPVRGVRVTAGDHTFRVKLTDHREGTFSTRVVPGATTVVPCTLSPIERPGRDVRPAASNASDGRSSLGLILAIAGTAVVGGSFVVDTTVLGPTLDDFKSSRLAGDGRARSLETKIDGLQTALLVSYSAGALFAVGGLVLWLWPKSAPASTASISARPGGITVDVPW